MCLRVFCVMISLAHADIHQHGRLQIIDVARVRGPERVRMHTGISIASNAIGDMNTHIHRHTHIHTHSIEIRKATTVNLNHLSLL